MSGSIDTSRALPSQPRLREPITDDMAEMVENIRRADPSAIADTAEIGQAPPPAPSTQDTVATPAPPTPAAPAPAGDPPKPGTKKLVVEMEIDSKLMDSGEINNLEPVFVKSADKNNPVVVNTPTVLNAFEETPQPDGQVTHWAPIAVSKEMEASGQLANMHGEMVPNDAAPVLTQSEFAKKLQESYDQGHKDALPPGMVPKVADSKRGLKTQQLGNLGAQMIGEVGGQFASTSLAGIWKMLPVSAAAPLALAAAPIQVFGPDGHLKTLQTIQDQEGWLENYRDNEHKDKINLAVGPKGTLVPTAIEQPINETLKNLQATELSTKIKLGGSAMLAGAGVSALVGGAVLGGAALVATPVLATGAMLAPIGAGFVTQKRQFDNLRDQKAVLVAFQAQGQTTTKVPVADADGNVKDVDMPIDKQIATLNKQMKVAGLGMTISGTSAGIIIAIAAGAPVMLAMGALAVPAAVGVAMFPKETWDFIKNLPEKAWAALSAAFHFVGNAVSHIFHHGDKGGGKPDTVAGPGGPEAPDSPSVVKLRDTVARFRDVDPEQAQKLQDAAERLNTPPQKPEDVAAYQKATEDLNAALEALGKKDPEAVKAWQDGMQTLNQERAQVARESLTKAVEQFMGGQGQAILQSSQVQDAMKSMGVDQDSASGMLSHMAAAQLTGDNHILNDLATAGKTDPEAAKLVKFGEVLGQAYERMGQQQVQKENLPAPATTA